MNTIIERFVSIQEVMDALCLQVTNYNWLVTDLDAVISNDSLKYFEEIQELEEGTAYWIKGERLLELVQHTNLYVIWGVFTAFERETSIRSQTGMAICGLNHPVFSIQTLCVN